MLEVFLLLVVPVLVCVFAIVFYEALMELFDIIREEIEK